MFITDIDHVQLAAPPGCGAEARQLHIGVESAFRPAGIRCAWDHGLPRARRFCASDPWGNRLEFTEPAA